MISIYQCQPLQRDWATFEVDCTRGWDWLVHEKGVPCQSPLSLFWPHFVHSTSSGCTLIQLNQILTYSTWDHLANNTWPIWSIRSRWKLSYPVQLNKRAKNSYPASRGWPANLRLTTWEEGLFVSHMLMKGKCWDSIHKVAQALPSLQGAALLLLGPRWGKMLTHMIPWSGPCMCTISNIHCLLQELWVMLSPSQLWSLW